MGRSTTKKQNTTLLNMRNIIYINEKISGGNTQISGIDDSLEAIYIAHILNLSLIHI